VLQDVIRAREPVRLVFGIGLSPLKLGSLKPSVTAVPNFEASILKLDAEFPGFLWGNPILWLEVKFIPVKPGSGEG
jgi:hypothetical protein